VAVSESVTGTQNPGGGGGDLLPITPAQLSGQNVNEQLFGVYDSGGGGY
jgi:hypothetical protein